MSVPAYGDLGKSVRNLYRTGYAYDRAKLELTAPLTEGLGIQGDAAVDLRSFSALGSILLKYKTEGYGQFSGKYATVGPIVAEYALNGVLSENVDVAAGYSVNLADSFHSASLAAKFHNSVLHAQAALTKDMDRSVDLLGSVVVKIHNFLIGYQTGFDTNTSEITKNNLAVAVQEGNVGLYFRCIQIPREFGLSAVYQVNEKLEVATDAKIASKDDTRLWFTGACFAYQLDDQCKLRMKMDKNLQLGTSLQMKLKEKMMLTLAFSLDLTNPSSGEHKVGMGLSIEG